MIKLLPQKECYSDLQLFFSDCAFMCCARTNFKTLGQSCFKYVVEIRSHLCDLLSCSLYRRGGRLLGISCTYLIIMAEFLPYMLALVYSSFSQQWTIYSVLSCSYFCVYCIDKLRMDVVLIPWDHGFGLRTGLRTEHCGLLLCFWYWTLPVCSWFWSGTFRATFKLEAHRLNR